MKNILSKQWVKNCLDGGMFCVWSCLFLLAFMLIARTIFTEAFADIPEILPLFKAMIFLFLSTGLIIMLLSLCFSILGEMLQKARLRYQIIGYLLFGVVLPLVILYRLNVSIEFLAAFSLLAFAGWKEFGCTKYLLLGLGLTPINKK